MCKAIHYYYLMYLRTLEICLKIYELDPAKFLSAPGLAWKAVLKKSKVKLNLLTDIDMLLMVKKVIRGGKCHSIYRYTKANNKYMKDYDKDFIKNYNEESNEGYFLEGDIKYPEKLINFIMIYHFYQKE